MVGWCWVGRRRVVKVCLLECKIAIIDGMEFLVDVVLLGREAE